ncbi:MAG: L,D-transpeptidase [Acidimicrobiia bacterium]
MHKRLIIVGVAVALISLAAPAAATESVGVVDPSTGLWYLRDPSDGATTSFYYGNPGDAPFMGDWDCDGVDTPGLYRRSDGYVYLRNTNTQGIADHSFYFGNPGDLPVVGDFNGDGCDTVSLHRPSEQRFYLIDRLGDGEQGLGAADRSIMFGIPGDRPLAADFDGNGRDDIAVQRGATVHYLTDSGEVGISAVESGVAVPGSWTGGNEEVGWFRDGLFDLGGSRLIYGSGGYVPVAGEFGTLPGGDVAPATYPNVGTGKRIIYANGRQRVWLVNEDGSLAHTWPVSGKYGVPEPGSYVVYSKSMWTSAGHNGIYMTYMTRFAWGKRLSIGFHAIPRYGDGTAMQTYEELGTFQSAGCVRLADENAIVLFGWAPVGTPVFVLP